MTIGNLVAIGQNDIKRLLGYSTIAHAGYLLVGLAAIAQGARETTGGTTLGPSSLLFYLGAYTLTNLAAFFAVIAIAEKTGSERIDDFAGMGRRSPVLATLLALSMVSLIGVPPTALFFGKLYIFVAAVQSGLPWLAIVGVVNSVISAYYYLRVVRVMFLEQPKSDEPVPVPPTNQLALLVTSLGVLFFGIAPGPLLHFAQAAVGTLLRAA
jgi:NADH-quinone oxidoreductase subunit N